MFVPFTVGRDKNNIPTIKKSVTEAAIMQVAVDYTSTSTAIDLTFRIHRETSDNHGVFYMITNNPGTTLNPNKDFSCTISTGQISTVIPCDLKGVVENENADTEITSASQVFVPASGSTAMVTDRISNNQLTAAPETTGSDGKTYKDVTIKKVISPLTANTTYYLNVWAYNGNLVPEGISFFLDKKITTSVAGQTNQTPTTVGTVETTGDGMPSCVFAHPIDGTFVGCIAQLIYYVVFVPTSYIFGLAGMFFDTTFNYSIQDKSYNNSFVVEGWGIIRDFCNIFFIFVLLYVAFSTILGLGHSKPKEMIVNVVIIGLLINFSLFTAQVIIDTSNILARVFYNSDAVKVTKDGVDQAGANGVIPISASIVSKVDPQQLIINSSRVSVLNKATGEEASAGNKNSTLGVGGFILITLLASAVNVVGFIVFLMVGIMLVSRVIGLWFAMIFAPLAFFSYTVPQMQGMSMVGWKHWWPETIKLAFLAPIFIFFLYLILRFIELGFGLGDAAKESGINFVLLTMIPFIFIMVLLWKAKDVAKDLSGKLGQGITGGISAVGGMALGGAALGAAFAGRKLIGSTVARASRGDTLSQRYEDPTKRAKMNVLQKSFGYMGSKVGLGKVFGNTYDAKTRTVDSGIGGVLNKKQRKVGEIDHARHEMDAIKEKAGLKGVDDDRISGVNEQKMKDTYVKEKKSMVESELRKNGGVVGGQKVESENEFKANNRNQLVTKAMNDPNNLEANGTLKDEAKKQIENTLNANYEIYIKPQVEAKAAQDYGHLRDESKTKVNPLDRTIARSNTASYDARNISQMKADKREGIFTRMSAGLIAGIAMGVRTGLKNSGINHGSGQSDFLKDIGHTITEAMKSAKFNVKVEESHGHDAGGDHGHGGGGHH